MPRAQQQGRVTALDGIRGLAILGVVAFHTGLADFGWIGVIGFFVLSGHLITRILVERGGKRRERMRNFVRNRALRLGPLYVVFCVALTVIALAGVSPAKLPGDLPYLWTWTYNLRALLPGGDSENPYNHLWSLGVEVQLYALWLGLALLLARRRFVQVVVILALAGPVVRLVVWLGLQKAGFSLDDRLWLTYRLPTTYIDAFAIGACTALPEIRSRLRSAPGLAAGLGIAILVVAVVDFVTAVGRPRDFGFPIQLDRNVGWLWGYTLLALLAGAIVLIAYQGGRLSRGLSRRPLVWFGTVSYGLYVVHYPIVILVHGYLPERWSLPSALLGAAVVLVASAVAAAVSYRFIERPFIAMKRGGMRSPIEERRADSLSST